jgi:hypothetical protein
MTTSAPAPPCDVLSPEPLSLATAAATANEAQNWKEIEEEDDNMLVKVERPRLRWEFFDYLEGRTSEIEGIPTFHEDQLDYRCGLFLFVLLLASLALHIIYIYKLDNLVLESQS